MTSYCPPSRATVPIILDRGSAATVPAFTMSIRTSTGRAVCGSVISTTIATARSRASHSTLVIRCRAVSSITTESWRSRKRTGAHSSPARGGTHSVTAMSQSRRPCTRRPRLAQGGQLLFPVPQDTHQHLTCVLAIQRRHAANPAPRLPDEYEGHPGAQERTGNWVVDGLPEPPGQ